MGWYFEVLVIGCDGEKVYIVKDKTWLLRLAIQWMIPIGLGHLISKGALLRKVDYFELDKVWLG